MKEEQEKQRKEAIASAVELCEQGEVAAALGVLKSAECPADAIKEQMTEECARAFFDSAAIRSVWEEKCADGQAEGRLRLAVAFRDCAGPLFGEGTADAGRLLQSAGVLFLALGDSQAAYDTCCDALRYKEESLGDSSPELCSTLKMLGNAAWKMDSDAVQQEAMLQRSLRIEEKAFGKQSPEVARTLKALGLCYETMKKPAKAQQVLARAHGIYTAAGEEDEAPKRRAAEAEEAAKKVAEEAAKAREEAENPPPFTNAEELMKKAAALEQEAAEAEAKAAGLRLAEVEAASARAEAHVQAGLTLGLAAATAENRKAERDYFDRAYEVKASKYGTWTWPPCLALEKAYNPRKTGLL